MQRVATRLGRRLIGVPEASSAPISDKLIITEVCAACYRERLASGRAAAYPVVRSLASEKERAFAEVPPDLPRRLFTRNRAVSPLAFWASGPSINWELRRPASHSRVKYHGGRLRSNRCESAWKKLAVLDFWGGRNEDFS